MKKSLYFACFCVFAFFTPIFATPVCAKDSIVTVVLDPSIGATGYVYNSEAWAWKANFSYGTITGISTCSSVAPTGVMGSTKTSAGTPLDAVAGDLSGKYCWCKMTHPMSSLWVFNGQSGDASACALYCTRDCGLRNQSGPAFRDGLFGSVAAANAAF